MVKIKTLAAALALSTMFGCGMKSTEQTVEKPKEVVVQTVKNIDVCIKDSSGRPIQNSSGLCWNPGEIIKSKVIVEPEKPVVQSVTDTVKPTISLPKTIEQQKADVIEKLVAEIEKPKEKTILFSKKPVEKKLVVSANKPKSVLVPKLETTKVFPKVEPVPEVIGLLDKISHINITVESPSKIKLDEIAKVELLVDLSKIPNKDKITTNNIFTAKLFSPQFSTTTVSKSTQSIQQGSLLKWEWELTPQNSGKHELVISLSTTLPDINSEKYIGTYNKEIKVTKSWFVTLIRSLSVFLLATAIMGPIYIYFFSKRKKP